MFTAYVVVAVLTAAASTSIATLDFIHSEWVLANMTKVGVPPSWLFSLGASRRPAHLDCWWVSACR